MLFKRFFDENLAHYSYLVGCQATGEAVVIDPGRNLEPYLMELAAEGMNLTAVTETHIHADFASGARELAARTGAHLYLSDEGDANWKYAFPGELVKDGFEFWVGKVKLQVVATPGHTPEHISFLLTDTPATDKPMGMFTGDFLFVGDVGRPDLLERAAGFENTMETGARVLYRSLQKLKDLPDHLQIWPAHGAGSACGKGLGAVPQTTLGYERLTNWALKPQSEDEFVKAVLSGQPDPPRYFSQMKRINKQGPALLSERPAPALMPASALSELLAEGAMVIDLRPAPAYAAGFAPGTLNLPLNKSFTTWAGWLLPYDQDLYLITDQPERSLRDLASIGLDRVVGVFRPEAVEKMPRLRQIKRMAPSDIRPGEVRILDVRNDREWESGHVPGAIHIPLGQLELRADELTGDRPLAVHCRSGARSAMAASLLHRLGFTEVIDLGPFPQELMALTATR